MNYVKLVMISFCLIVFSAQIQASGSHSMDGDMSDHKNSAYNKGKAILHKHVVCDACPLKTANLDEQSAMTIIEKLQSGSAEFSSLSDMEKSSVVTYLEERFKLK